ncbi:MAG: hypothetical protein K6C13_05980 [Oscillospiraceae bacterium]|nr:hypothetical protein [Oscillospiraceae bacterium]
MKNVLEFIRKHSLVIAIIGAILFLVIFFSFLFKKVGDDVYIIDVSGDVSIGSTADLKVLSPAQVGMKLKEGNIIVTKDKSSCVVAYSKRSGGKDNFVNIAEDSQVMLYSKNSQGGYNFFVTYGSLICNMPVDRSYRTNISSRLFNVYVDNTITKISYDDKTSMGKVFTFDGNPQIQLVQPSGSLGASEKLLKNSVCAVTADEDGIIGFGYLNIGFGLNDLTAQDLRVMSGLANTWSEKLAYDVGEIEQAYQTASDVSKWLVEQPVISTEAPVSAEPQPVIPSETYVTGGFLGEEEDPEITVSASSDVHKLSGEQGTRSTYDPNASIYYTEFYRKAEETTVTTVPSETTETEKTARTTAPYGSETSKFTTTARTERTTTQRPAATTMAPFTYEVPYKTYAPVTDYTYHQTSPSYYTQTYTPSQYYPPQTSAYAPVTAAPSVTQPYETSSYYNTGTKPVIETTVPSAPLDPNAIFTVIFSYTADDIEYWSVQLVKCNHAAILPEEPEVPGRTFLGWDADVEHITSSIEIHAVFDDSTGMVVVTPARETYTVDFYVDSLLWKSVEVKSGDSIELKEKPEVEGKIFCGWSDSLTDIRSDTTVFALFSDK